MRAIIANTEDAVLRDVPQPSPGPDQALVRVKAGAMNRAGIKVLEEVWRSVFR
jgi:NADPH:quinone reductase-like Zn-dependent oxidoreductase